MILESIAEQFHIRMAIHELASKVTFEEAIFIATIRHGDRCRIIVLDDEHIATAVRIKLVISFRQFLRILVDEHAADERQIKLLVRVKFVNRLIVDMHAGNLRASLRCLGIDLDGRDFNVRDKLPQCDEVQPNVRTVF